MLYGSGLSKGFWGEAALCFNHTRNRTPTSALKGSMTPMEAWTGVKPKVHHLKAFGCKVSVHIPDNKRKKLDPKSYPGVFLGYSIEKKGYRVFDSRKISVEDSRDVIFYEESQLKKNMEFEEFQFSTMGSEEDTQEEPSQKPGEYFEQEAENPLPFPGTQVPGSGFQEQGGNSGSRSAPKTRSGSAQEPGTTDQNPKPYQNPTDRKKNRKKTYPLFSRNLCRNNRLSGNLFFQRPI